MCPEVQRSLLGRAPRRGGQDILAVMGHVVLNALLLSQAASYRGAGISAYERHLITAMAAVGREMTLTAVIAEPNWQAPAPVRTYRAPGWTRRPLLRILWEQAWLPTVVRRFKAHLLHGLAFVTPVWNASIPHVVTVHDLSFVRFPETLPAWKARYLRWFTRRSLKQAARIIAVSHSTRRDILQWLNLRPERVVAVHNGVESRFRPLPAEKVATWRARRGLPERFVLYLGTLQPRKNLETLVRAFARWRQRGGPYTRDVVLVLAGARGWFYEHLFRLVKDLGLDRYVLFPGYVPAEDLPWWYNAATVFAYPSLFEGFGLPVLEAMACGTPVLVANTSSLPEIVGDAGCLLPPQDVDAWANALHDVMTLPEKRREMAEQGLARAGMFSWERTAQQTLAVYQDVLESVHE